MRSASSTGVTKIFPSSIFPVFAEPAMASTVRNHGGQINLASQAGEGTTVTVRWPTVSNRPSRPPHPS